MSESFACDRCSSVFQRREHLQRHTRVHTKERPFACSVCEQRFARIDALSRHYSSLHQPSADQGDASADHSKPVRVAKACQACASAKVRCDGDSPCRRCSQLNTSCSYKPRNKRKESSSQRRAAPKQPRLAQYEREISFENVSETTTTPTTIDPHSAVPDLFMETCSTLDTVGPCTAQLDAPPNDANDINRGMPLLDSSYEKMNEMMDPFPMETFTNLIDWNYGGLDAPNITLSYILGADLPTYIDEPAPTAGLFGDSIDPAFPQPFVLLGSAGLNHQSMTGEASIAECYSRAHSPPLDQDKLEIRHYEPGLAELEKQLGFPDMTGFTADELDKEDHAHVEAFYSSRFQPVLELAEKINASGFFPQWTQLRLPPGEVLNVFIQLYFEHFHPLFPLIHMPTFSSPETHPILILAVAAIGAKYSKLRGAPKCSLAMHELIRQQTLYLAERATKLSRQLWLIEAAVLNLVGLMYSGDKESLQNAESLQSVPVVLARRAGLFEEKLSPAKMSTLQLPRDRLWQLWVFAEGRRRLAHAIWIIDSSFSLHFELCTTMEFSEIRNCLPQSDELWSAPSAQAWVNTTALLNPVRDTMAQAFLDSDRWAEQWRGTSTLGRQAIAQFLWHTAIKPRQTITWRLEAPSYRSGDCEQASKRISDMLLLGGSGVSDASRLDSNEVPILSATCHIAQAKYYCPIANFSTIIIRYSYKALDQSTLEEATSLWTRSIKNAKIAVLHASCVFEIVRKYRPNFFSVSVMLFKAVLTLWSYSKFLLPKPRNKSDHGLKSILLGCGASSDSKDLWLNSDNVVLKLAGIGNLDNASSRRRLLEEAIASMEMSSVWMLSQSFARCLNRLKERELVQDEDNTQ